MDQQISTVTTFKTPYFIEALGEDGLTAKDIAESLDVNVKHVRQKLKRGWLEKSKCVESFKSSLEDKNNINGLDTEEIFLNTAASKAFVAQYQSEKGFKYLAFLLNCEVAVPELVAQIKSLQEKLELHEAQSIQDNKKLLKEFKKGMILAPVYEKAALHDVLELRWELRHKDTMNEIDLLKAKIRHSQKVQAGMAKKILELQQRLDQAELGNKNKILTLIK
jgi:hypothetical protein